MKFEINEDQKLKISEWLSGTVYPHVIALQRESYVNPEPFIVSTWERGYPYEGASGGGLIYEFTPTSIDVISIVRYKNAGCDMTLDLTDYSMW